MASKSKKVLLSGEPLHQAQARTKAALDQRDEKSIVRLLKDAGVTSYEPRVVSHLVDRMRRYTREVLIDARDYADHAGRTDLGMQDVRLAVRKKQDALSAGPPSREDQIRQADEVNRIPLPAIPDKFGVRLPPFEYQNTLPNLQWEAHAEPRVHDEAGETDVDPEQAQSSLSGNRNKKTKTTPGLETKKPLTLKEKKEQEEANRAKAEAKAARRRLQAQNAKRG
ncbi:unnamed protein product [Ectocarpus sp. CCAP 1310/34]|nr:unnamed protein product [Ectocarpus sp. CCAP 1310/34]